MWWIFCLVFVIYSGVAPSKASDLIVLHPNLQSAEIQEGADYNVACEVKNENNIEWRNPKGHVISGDRKSNTFVEDVRGLKQLRFQNVSTQHAGKYTCVASIGGKHYDKLFELSVIEKIRFFNIQPEYWATFGSSALLRCEAKSSITPAITWSFKGVPIEGGTERIIDDGFLVKNVTEETVGKYGCTASIITNWNSFVETVNIDLKMGVAPTINKSYKNNTVRAAYNEQVTITCTVNAVPSADVRWVKDNKDEAYLKNRYNATITTTDNQSSLKFILNSEDMLGEYTCKAANKFASSSQTFKLASSDTPDAPIYSLRDVLDKTIRFDITSNNSVELSNFRVKYQKTSNSNDSTSWTYLNFALKESITDPYSINDLEPDTSYNFQIGACINDDTCTYGNVSSIVTQIVAASSTNTIHTVVTQIFFLLPAFLLGIAQRQRNT